MIDTCKANLIQHPPAMAENSRVPAKKARGGEGRWGPCRRVSPIFPVHLWWELHCLPQQELGDGVYFRMECEACRPQRASTPLKSMVHLAGSPSGQINKTPYSSTQRGKYKHVPNIKSLACGMTAVYETVYVQTWKYASEGFLDWQSSHGGNFTQCTVKAEAYKRNTAIKNSDNIWKYMAQFIFIVAINWQLIWIISSLRRDGNITYRLTYQGCRGSKWPPLYGLNVLIILE